ncbi:UNVERIFIED_CONTAM: dockerin type I repeat protein [Acetivibrio alkalicellulosi]
MKKFFLTALVISMVFIFTGINSYSNPVPIGGLNLIVTNIQTDDYYLDLLVDSNVNTRINYDSFHTSYPESYKELPLYKYNKNGWIAYFIRSVAMNISFHTDTYNETESTHYFMDLYGNVPNNFKVIIQYKSGELFVSNKTYSYDQFDQQTYIDFHNDMINVDMIETDIIYGDLNGDGIVNSIDAVLMRRYILGIATNIDINTENADINGDGKINSIDYVLLKRYILEIINDLSVYNNQNNQNNDPDLFRAFHKGGSRTLVEVIKSNTLLEAVFEEYSMNNDIENVLKKYTDEYLENKGLVFISLEEHSGSIRHEFKSVNFDNGVCTITINKHIPKVLTGDVAHWVFLIPVDKNEIASTEKIEINIIEEHEEKNIEYKAIKWGQPIAIEYTDFFAATRIKSNSELVDLFDGIQIEEFENALRKYTDEYLENNGLVLLAIEETSGSILLDIENIEVNQEALDIDMTRYIPLEGTTDMAYWVFLIDVPLSILDKISEFELKFEDIRQDGSGYQLLRTHSNVVEYPTIEILKSNSQLMDMFSDNLSDDVKETLNKYNDQYFKHRDLVFIALEESSGSIRHELIRSVHSNGMLIVDIERFVPLVGTDDMAYWVFLIEAFRVNEVKLNITSQYARDE